MKILYGIGFVVIKQMINDIFKEKGKIAMTLLYSITSIFVAFSMVYYKLIVNYVNYNFLMISYGILNIIGIVPLTVLIILERNRLKEIEEQIKSKGL